MDDELSPKVRGVWELSPVTKEFMTLTFFGLVKDLFVLFTCELLFNR